MKGFFQWFKSSTKMKRWMLIILIGIVLACIGISKIMVSKTVSFTEIGTVIALFVVGFTMIIIGLVYSQKRVLEILVEDTDYRMDNGTKERNVKSLIFNKKIYNEGPNIVVIGGGSGLNTVLKGLKKYTSNLTAIVTVSAYGKEQTESRKKLELLPIEDIKDSIISLSNDEEMMANLLDTELKDMHFEIKELYTFTITIKKVETVKVVDVINTPFNIYIAGGDAYGDIGNVTNTDVNMIATVDPVNKKILLTSIPRDYYVNLPSFGEDAYDKLTHAGYYGIEESILAVEKLLDIEINYYVKVNFSTIEGVIDAIGGVDVYSDYAFQADVHPYYYQFKKGNNHLNGSQALSFARERKSFSDGDVQRVKNQQKVLEAIINKVTKSTAIITSYSEILDSVSTSFSTNLDSKSISRLVKMQLNDMKMWNIESQNLTGTDYYTENTYTFPGTELYVMNRKEDSVTTAIEKIKTYTKNK